METTTAAPATSEPLVELAPEESVLPVAPLVELAPEEAVVPALAQAPIGPAGPAGTS